MLATKVEKARLDKLVSELSESSGFLSGESLRKLIIKNLPMDVDEDTISALWRLVLGLHEVIHENDVSNEQQSEFFELVVQSAKEDADTFPDQLGQELLRRLSGPFLAVRRQAKAIRMVKAAGHQLSEFKFVCDLRPVFTPGSRGDIDGVIPLTTLTMETIDASGKKHRNEVVLSYQELQLLIDEAKVAHGKLDKLIELAQNAKVTVPDLKMTRRPPSESEATCE
ncbi:MAG: hypothetical protein ACK56W_17705 [Pirellula sp.]